LSGTSACSTCADGAPEPLHRVRDRAEYDAYIWLEETQAVEPVPLEEIEALPEEHPFAL
jgi:hypothetical protein